MPTKINNRKFNIKNNLFRFGIANKKNSMTHIKKQKKIQSQPIEFQLAKKKLNYSSLSESLKKRNSFNR